MGTYNLENKLFHGIRNNINTDLIFLEAIFRNNKIVCRKFNPFYIHLAPNNFAGNDYVCLASKKNIIDFDYSTIINDIIENLNNKEQLRNIKNDVEINILTCINERNAYFKFIERNISLIINPNGQEIKTVLTNIDQNLLNLNGPVRYTNLTGEYHVKYTLDLENVTAIGYPLHVLESLNHIKFLLYDMDEYQFYKNKNDIETKKEKIKILIKKYNLPFSIIDTHKKELID